MRATSRDGYASDVKILHVVGAAIVQGDTCLVAERGPGMRLAGKWEFPGGKVEADETPSSALRREIFEELGLVIEVGPLLGVGEAPAGDARVRLEVYAATVASGVLVLREHARVAWAKADELGRFDWAEADVPIHPAVAAFLREQS